jgi:hypothetical protein
MEIKDLVPTLPIHPKKKVKFRKLSNIKKIVVHTTDWNIEPLELAKYDIGPNHIDSTGCPSITYHYYIGKDGTVARTAAEEWVTWHAAGYNTESVAICLAYKTDPLFESGKISQPGPNNKPTEEMLKALDALLVYLCKRLKVNPKEILGHRELEGTGFTFQKGHKQLRKTCPGMTINLDILRARVFSLLQTEMMWKGFYTGRIDGLWGPKSEASFQLLLDGAS